jgi:hypothetical protein
VCGNDAAPFRIDGIGIRESENRRLDAGQHSLGLAWSEAEPLFSIGRVQTAQSSIRFCDLTQRRLPSLLSLAMASRACRCCGLAR